MHWRLRFIWGVALVLGVGCGSSRLQSALREGGRQYKASQWQRAIDEVQRGLREIREETSNSHPWEDNESEVQQAHLLMARAHRKLGHPAEALVNFDIGLGPHPPPEPGLEAERRALKQEFIASVAGPPSARLRIVHRELLPTWFQTVSVEYTVDDESVFSWKVPETRPRREDPTLVTERALSPGKHYVKAYVVGWAGPYRFRMSSPKVFATSRGKTTDVTVLVIDHGAKGRNIEDNLDIEIGLSEY